MNESNSDIDLRIAERRVRRWLADQFLLEVVHDKRDLAFYEFNPEKEFLFRLRNPSELRVGSDRYVSVHKSTEEIRQFHSEE